MEEANERKVLLGEFWTVLNLHESMFYQKSRSQWLKDGDQNTKYFHSLINWRRCTNSIVGLMIDGTWEEDPQKVKSEVKKYFEQRFTANQGWD